MGMAQNNLRGFWFAFICLLQFCRFRQSMDVALPSILAFLGFSFKFLQKILALKTGKGQPPFMLHFAFE